MDWEDMKRRLEENKLMFNIRRWWWIDYMKEIENFYYLVGILLEFIGE